jgi:hypothetical protein
MEAGDDRPAAGDRSPAHERDAGRGSRLPISTSRKHALFVTRLVENDPRAIHRVDDTRSTRWQLDDTRFAAPRINEPFLEAEATLARGDHIVEEMRREARERREAGEQEDGR